MPHTVAGRPALRLPRATQRPAASGWTAASASAETGDASCSADDGDRRYAAGPVYGYLGGGCAVWGRAMADAVGTLLHRHDRANPAIGGAVTCF